METQKLFGMRAVERGFVTEAQVLDALRSQYSAKVLLGKHLFLGEIMLLQGMLSPRQLTDLLRETGENHEEAEDVVSKRFFGDVAVELGFVTAKEVFEALNRQFEDDARGERHRLVGEILYASGKLTREQVERVVAALVGKKPVGAAR
jgi:hypothetical protein